MPHKLLYDWNEIQKYYDEGNSIRDCARNFGFSPTARSKAIKSGRLKLRSHEEACDLRRKHEKPILTNQTFSNTTLMGELACSKFDLRAVEKGIVVSRPNLECSYDRIADINGLHRVQIKYAGQSTTSVLKVLTVKTCRSRKCKVPYLTDEIDVIVAYSPISECLYWLPKEIWEDKREVHLRLTEPKNKKNTCVYAKDFLW